MGHAGNHDESMGKAPHVYMDGTNNSAADQFTVHTPKSRPGMGSRINYGPKLGTEIPGSSLPRRTEADMTGSVPHQNWQQQVLVACMAPPLPKAVPE